MTVCDPEFMTLEWISLSASKPASERVSERSLIEPASERASDRDITNRIDKHCGVLIDPKPSLGAKEEAKDSIIKRDIHPSQDHGG